ncbi:MAG: hypothetical protein IKC63_01630 [Clostridia bacterium]|nr:hypothetical protein [Clostridia bacterium]
MRKTRILSLVMAIVLVLGSVALLASCSKEVEYQEIDPADAVAHSDFTSVYDKIGSKVTIDMVKEDANGIATVEVEGKTYTLGMDFLSMAMVYNTQVPEGNSAYQSSEDVYNEWWKLYIQRWNYLCPEIPLYSNQYFDLYNGKIANFITTPYWSPADAVIAATIEGENTQVILGSSTDLSGAFRSSSFGKSSPGSSDLDIENLTSGYATVQTNMDGALVWNMDALEAVPVATTNEDGTLTYTIKVKSDLKFSDGSAINAKNYIASLLANSTPVVVEAGASGTSGLQLVGFKAFNAYTGEGETVYFDGVKLIDDYTFSVTFTADYAGYYYTMSYASFSPTPLALYLGEGDIVVNETTKACGLNAAFYATEEKDGKTSYKTAAQILDNLKWNSNLPWSGPYVVSNYDESTLTATLTLNPNYTKDVRGKASIDKIIYIKQVSETQMDMFTKGELDVVAGITGGTDTKNALKIVEESNGKFKETHYDRAGYGKLGFRSDYGPTSMVEVRQAIMYTINRPEFAATFTGGYGAVVHGPYYTGSAAYKAVKDEIKLNQYTYSSDNAIKVLTDAGWIYNEKGEEFNPETDAVRYKKLSGYELSADNLNFKSIDSKYKTVKIDGSYYMPLAINWYGTQPNDVTDQLVTAWQTNPNATTAIGMYITYTECDFNGGLYGELYRYEQYGYDGTPKLNAVNFATGFTSAIYDYSFNWTINPDMYDQYQMAFIADEADFWENYN